MRGTFVYDIVTAVGMVLMVFLIIYWSVQYGTEMVANMFLSDPAIIQGALASAISFSCRPFDFEFSLKSAVNVPSNIDLRENTIQIVPPPTKFRDWTSVERGGYVQYRSIEPSALITCSSVQIQKNILKTEKTSSAVFTVVKNSSGVGLAVR